MGHPFTNTRSSYTIGRLINLARDDDDFFELVSIRLLVEPNHPTSLRAAAARLTLACSSVWLFPFILDDSVLEKLIEWTKEESPEDEERFLTRPGAKWGRDAEKRDKELLRTYATGLLAVALQNEEIVDDVVRQGLVEPLVKFLRRSVLRNDGKAGQKQGPKVGALFSPGGAARKRAKVSVDAPWKDENRVGSENAPEGVVEARVEGKGKGKVDEANAENDEGFEGESDEALDEFYHRQGIEGDGDDLDEEGGTEIGRVGLKTSKSERRKSKMARGGGKKRAANEEGAGGASGEGTNAEEPGQPERKRRKSRKGGEQVNEAPGGEALGGASVSGVLAQTGPGKLAGETARDVETDKAGATALKLANEEGTGGGTSAAAELAEEVRKEGNGADARKEGGEGESVQNPGKGLRKQDQTRVDSVEGAGKSAGKGRPGDEKNVEDGTREGEGSKLSEGNKASETEGGKAKTKEKDLPFVLARAREAAESEARDAGAPQEAVVAAGDAAYESVSLSKVHAFNTIGIGLGAGETFEAFLTFPYIHVELKISTKVELDCVLLIFPSEAALPIPHILKTFNPSC